MNLLRTCFYTEHHWASASVNCISFLNWQKFSPIYIITLAPLTITNAIRVSRYITVAKQPREDGILLVLTIFWEKSYVSGKVVWFLFIPCEYMILLQIYWRLCKVFHSWNAAWSCWNLPRHTSSYGNKPS